MRTFQRIFLQTMLMIWMKSVPNHPTSVLTLRMTCLRNSHSLCRRFLSLRLLKENRFESFIDCPNDLFDPDLGECLPPSQKLGSFDNQVGVAILMSVFFFCCNFVNGITFSLYARWVRMSRQFAFSRAVENLGTEISGFEGSGGYTGTATIPERKIEQQ